MNKLLVHKIVFFIILLFTPICYDYEISSSSFHYKIFINKRLVHKIVFFIILVLFTPICYDYEISSSHFITRFVLINVGSFLLRYCQRVAVLSLLLFLFFSFL